MVVLFIHPSRRSFRHSSVPPSIQGKEQEEEDDSWWRQYVRTQSLDNVISAKSIQTFGGEIASMEQYTHQDPQPMNKAKMHNVLERNKLKEDQMLILLLLPPPQQRPPQQHVATTASPKPAISHGCRYICMRTLLWLHICCVCSWSDHEPIVK